MIHYLPGMRVTTPEGPAYVVAVQHGLVLVADEIGTGSYAEDNARIAPDPTHVGTAALLAAGREDVQ